MKLLAVADALTAATGRGIAWLAIALVLVEFSIVVLRAGFNLGWIGMQESVLWLHATLFLGAAAWTLQVDGHVRVDIFYRKASPRRKAMTNLLGSLFLLLPVAIFMFIACLDYVLASWRVLEGSPEAGGLPGLFLLKSLMLVMPVLVAIQGLTDALRAWGQLREHA